MKIDIPLVRVKNLLYLGGLKVFIGGKGVYILFVSLTGQAEKQYLMRDAQYSGTRLEPRGGIWGT